MSLALADLLVCTVVMPFGAVTFIVGKQQAQYPQCTCCLCIPKVHWYLLCAGSWPLTNFWCVFYQTCDVLACSVSILHLMFISIGREALKLKFSKMLKIMIMLIVNLYLMFARDLLNFHCCLIITMPIMSELDHGLRKGKNLCMCRSEPLAGG